MGAEQSHLARPGDSPDFRQSYISFTINEIEYKVQTAGCDPEIGPKYLLVDYLRDKIGLTGTKYMCREGGCGACIVTIKYNHPLTGDQTIRSANSCLLPLFACDGLQITTVEGLGNRKTGYSEIQQRLVKFGGTQCGFCTPGFIMNMHSLSQSNPRFTTSDVEHSFDGNICRCTGFRPITDAFKSLSINSSEELKWKCSDIEDTYKCPLRDAVKGECAVDKIQASQLVNTIYLKGSSGEQWFKVTNLPTLFELLDKFTSAQMSYRLVAGNTGTGVYKNDGPYQVYIDINNVPELHHISIEPSGLVLGGGITLTTAIEIFDTVVPADGFVYAKDLHKHIRLVASHSVRNRATLAGNLILKYTHREFASDIFLLFESVGATVQIGLSPTISKSYTLLEFLEIDMRGKVILAFHLPTYKANYVYRSFRLGKRYQNTSSYVNAAFLFNIDPSSYRIMGKPTLCYGGISSTFVHATATEDFLSDKQLNSVNLQTALMVLQGEVVPDSRPGEASPKYRVGLAQSFLYRFALGVCEKSVDPRMKSGANDIPRGNCKGKQIFDTDDTQWPLNQPIPKIESYPQTSGEAEYINDIRAELDELFGVFVLSTVAKATIKFIDSSQALMIPGVVAFITAKDVPGRNNYAVFNLELEEIFAESKIRYAGQPLGLLLARDKYTAFEARSKVIVEYDNIEKPVLDIEEAVARAESKSQNTRLEDMNLAMPCHGLNTDSAKKLLISISKRVDEVDEEGKLEESLHKLEGSFTTPPQYHLHMETQICICVPKEDGMDVYSSTQWMDHTQAAIAGCLNVPNHTISVLVRRLGGAFGAKSTKASQVACACSIAAHITNMPVRVALDLETNMRMIGKRLPYLVMYSATVNNVGKIYKLDADIYCDTGASGNEPTSLFAMLCFQSCYHANGWHVTPHSVLTDTPPNTYCRAPGSSQGVAAIESVMEHIAFTVNKDPLEVREINFIHKGDPLIGVPGATFTHDNPLPEMIDELKVSGEYESRKAFVESFNQNNRWKKRGISIVPQRYPNYYPDLRFPTFIAVYHIDGSVNVSHGGIEMGQGINTKVAQVVAHTLQIPMEKVKVAPANNIVSPNTNITAASISSELVCSSAKRACEELLTRLEPLRKQLKNPTWEQLIAAANAQHIQLTSQFQHKQGEIKSYDDIWGVTLIEVLLDVLSGDHKIIRADIIEDTGKSLNPLVDVGQVEGAFVMGLGWWLSEQLIYDKNTGELLTDRTWNYKPLLAADIPEDFRVTLLRNAPNPFGVLSSKAVGEPPLNMSCAVIFALRNAIDSARREVGNHNYWYPLDGVLTREQIRDACLTSPEQFIV